jgi:bifunctional non-homologous end joining protein LigD
VPAHVSTEVKSAQNTRKDRGPIKSAKRQSHSSESNWSEVAKERIKNRETLELEDCSVDVYNVNREIWKGVTKGHLLHYYHTMSQYILPHLHDRPLSLYLKLKGAFAAGVYIKDMEGHQPMCSEIFTIERKHKKEGKRDIWCATMSQHCCTRLILAALILTHGRPVQIITKNRTI